MGWCTSRPSFSLDGLAATIAFDIQFEDRGVVDETVDGGERHGGIWKDLVPFAERLVGGDQHGSPFVAGADQRSPAPLASVALSNRAFGKFLIESRCALIASIVFGPMPPPVAA